MSLLGTAFALRPLCVARNPRMVRPCLSPVGQSHHRHPAIPQCARRTGFSNRVGAFQPTWLRPFDLPRPDAAGVVLCTHMMPGNTSILYLAHLVLSGWGYAELPLYGVLGSSSSKDMRMGAEVQNEKAPPR